MNTTINDTKPLKSTPVINEHNFITRQASGEEDVISFYEDYASSWDNRFPNSPSTLHFLERRWRSFLEVLGDGWENSHAVELGVGTGIYIERTARRFANIIAVDGSAGMLRKLDGKLQALGIGNVRLMQSNVLSMPAIESGAVDVVYFFGLIEHIVNLREFTAEIRRILRPGGIVIGVTPNGSSLWYVLRRWVRRTGKHCSTDTYYTRTRIQALFREAGFVEPVFKYWGAVPAGITSPLPYAGLKFAEKAIEPTFLAGMLGGLTFRFQKNS